MRVALRVEPAVAARLPRGAAQRLRRRGARALGALGRTRAQLSIVLCDDAAIRALNRAYRGLDRATDVLSFSQQEGAPIPIPIPSPDPGAALLGDVVISVETAARRRRRPLEQEIFVLLVHGIVHLCGYDHGTRAEARRMFALERRVRAEVARAQPPAMRSRKG